MPFLGDNIQMLFWRLYSDAFFGDYIQLLLWAQMLFGRLYTAASLETFSAAGAFWRREAEAGMEKIRHTISPLNHKLQNPKPSTLHSSEHTNPNPQTQCRPINPEPQNPKSSSPKGPKALNLSVSLDPRALGFKVLGFRALGFRALGLRAL